MSEQNKIKDSGDRTAFSTGAVRDMHDEEWRDCIGYDGIYEVSNLGRVRSALRKTRILDKEKYIMQQKLDSGGYYRVNLHKNGRMKAELVSRLVAKAFIPNPENLPFVGHNDDVKTNNSKDNLYWTDAKENNNHNGKMERFQNQHKAKIDIIAMKLSIPVKALSEETGEVLLFKSMQEAARVLGCNSGKICLCCKGIREHHKGYKWRYANENS